MDKKSKTESKADSKTDGAGSSKRILQELAALRADLEAVKAAQTAQNAPEAAASAAGAELAESGGGAGETGKIAERFLQSMQDAAGKIDGLSENEAEAFVGIACAYRHKSENNNTTADSLCILGGLTRLLETTDAQAAQLGLAFAAPQKIAVVRVLLTHGAQNARQLEEKADLTTGSLYHHLRELGHARVIENQARSRYQLTNRGREFALLLLGQAGRMEK